MNKASHAAIYVTDFIKSVQKSWTKQTWASHENSWITFTPRCDLRSDILEPDDRVGEEEVHLFRFKA